MKKYFIIIEIFIVCLIIVGFICFNIGSKTVKPQIIETVVEKEPNVDEIRELLKNEIYDDAYNEGYEKGKTEVFELMLESENTEDIKTTENTETITNNKSAEATQTTANQSSINTIDTELHVNEDEICPICGAVITSDNEHSHGYTNDDESNTIHLPTLTADSFTWSVSQDGMYTSSDFWTTATSKLHYYDYNNNDCCATAGLGITINPNGPGVYNIHWENSDGSLSCDQTVTLTE